MKILSLFVFLFSLNSFAFEDPQAAYKKSQAGDAVIIDVREEEEIKEGMIKGAQWFPLSRLKTDSKTWKKDFNDLTKNKEIYLYCRSGKRSQESLEILKENGIDSKNIGGWKTLKDELPTTDPK